MAVTVAVTTNPAAEESANCEEPRVTTAAGAVGRGEKEEEEIDGVDVEEAE